MMYYNEHLDGNMETEDVKVCVMKRSGERVPYDGNKIAAAIIKANNEEGILSERLTEQQITDIVSGIEKDARNAGRDLSVEEIRTRSKTPSWAPVRRKSQDFTSLTVTNTMKCVR